MYNPIEDESYTKQAYKYLLKSVTFRSLGDNQEIVCWNAAEYLRTFKDKGYDLGYISSEIEGYYGREAHVHEEVENRNIKIQLAIQAMNHVPDSEDHVLREVIKVLRRVANLHDCPEED